MLGLSNPSAVVLSAAITGTIAVASIIINGIIQTQQRKMAIAQRRHESIGEAYPRILQWALSEHYAAEKFELLFDQNKQLPPRMTDQEIIEIQTTMYAYSSEPLKQKLDQFMDARNGFWSDVDDHRISVERGSAELQKYESAHRQRDRMRTEGDTIRKMIRDELAES